MKKIKKLFFVGLLAFQGVSGGWLGIMVQDLTPALAARYGIHRATGVVVSRVQFNSPAMVGGLKEGDVLISLNRQKIRDSKALKEIISRLSPGMSVDVIVLRARREKTLKIVLGAIPRDAV